LKAFYRLAARLKRRFPRLPICLLLDSLYAGDPTFTAPRTGVSKICERGDLVSAPLLGGVCPQGAAVPTPDWVPNPAPAASVAGFFTPLRFVQDDSHDLEKALPPKRN